PPRSYFPSHRQLPCPEAEHRAPRQQRPRAEREMAARVEDVPVELRVASHAVPGDLGGPLEGNPRRLAPRAAEQAVLEMALVGRQAARARQLARVERI